jgi:hypothetical protein
LRMLPVMKAKTGMRLATARPTTCANDNIIQGIKLVPTQYE